jgi:chromosome partitioning protein
MSKTIAVANKKGGAGKSTLAINLAAAAAQIATAIIDLDPDQQAASKWRDSRTSDSPLVLPAVYSRLPQAVAEAEGKGDLPRLFQPVITEDFSTSANSFGVR